MSRALVQDLGRAGLNARRLRPDQAMPASGWLVRGVFTEVDPGSQLRRAVIGYNLGYCHVLTGSNRDGLNLLYASVRALLRRGAATHAMKAQLDLAFALLESARPRLAGRHAARALASAEQFEDNDAKKNALYLLGAAAVATGDRVGARRHFERLQQGFYPEADYLPELLLHVDVRELVNLKA